MALIGEAQRCYLTAQKPDGTNPNTPIRPFYLYRWDAETGVGICKRICILVVDTNGAFKIYGINETDNNIRPFIFSFDGLGIFRALTSVSAPTVSSANYRPYNQGYGLSLQTDGNDGVYTTKMAAGLTGSDPTAIIFGTLAVQGTGLYQPVANELAGGVTSGNAVSLTKPYNYAATAAAEGVTYRLPVATKAGMRIELHNNTEINAIVYPGAAQTFADASAFKTVPAGKALVATACTNSSWKVHYLSLTP